MWRPAILHILDGLVAFEFHRLPVDNSRAQSVRVSMQTLIPFPAAAARTPAAWSQGRSACLERASATPITSGAWVQCQMRSIWRAVNGAAPPREGSSLSPVGRSAESFGCYSSDAVRCTVECCAMVSGSGRLWSRICSRLPGRRASFPRPSKRGLSLNNSDESLWTKHAHRRVHAAVFQEVARLRERWEALSATASRRSLVQVETVCGTSPESGPMSPMGTEPKARH
jgi:hypothetical protein